MSQHSSSNSLSSEVDEIVHDGNDTDETSDFGSDGPIVFDDSDYSETDRSKTLGPRKSHPTSSRVKRRRRTRTGVSRDFLKGNEIRTVDEFVDAKQDDISWRTNHNEYDYHIFFKHLLDKNWNGIEKFMSSRPSWDLTVIKLLKQETFLHIVTRNLDVPDWLMVKLTSNIKPESLEKLTDESGRSPLFWAAMYGNKTAAEAFVRRSNKLAIIEDRNGFLPVHEAASCGHEDVIKYLLSQTRMRLDDERGVIMLNNLIKSGLYGIALDLLKRYPDLAGESEDRGSILTLLAKKPLAFESGSRLRYWKHFIYLWIPVQEDHISLPDICETVDKDEENPTDGTTLEEPTHTASGALPLSQKLHIKLWNALMLLVPSIKSIHDAKLTHMQTLEIVRIMCHEKFTWTKEEALQSLSMPILIAARFGICELVEEIIKAYFYSFTFINESTGHGILHLSILHRQENVFNLLNKMNLRLWHWKAAKTRGENNENILHLAGRLVPSTRVSGAALQMQRELQWFKAVESYVHPSLQEQQNKLGKTPRELFTQNHKSLVKEAEKWMKDTATSCTIVAALIITVVFSAAFTIPGGNDSKGIPNFLHEPFFAVFVISDGLALFSSTASLLMFLGILTSRYSEEDFLESLPKKLIMGLITLFFSIASMMVAFGAANYILLSDKWPLVYIPIAILGCLTVILFARSQFPLLIEMYLSTYRSRFC